MDSKRKTEVKYVYILYLDILLLLNTYMNVLVFYLASVILNKNIPFIKLVLGGIGAAILYSIILIFPEIHFLPNIFYSLFIPVIPIICLFKPVKMGEFIKIFFVCNVTAFILGGATFSFWYMINPYGSSNGINTILLLAVTSTVGFTIYLSFQFMRKMFILPHFEYQLRISHNNKEIDIKSIVDTGNCLYTPVDHKAVIVATWEALNKVLTDKEKRLIISFSEENILNLLTEYKKMPIYLIPFSSMGCSEGILPGIEVQHITIHRNGFSKTFDDCVIAISKGRIFSDNTYQALIHPDYII